MQKAIIFGASPASHETIDIVRIYNLCEQFHCLPRKGGLFDQDAYLIVGMNLVSEVKAEKEKKDAAEQEAKAKAQAKKKR